MNTPGLYAYGSSGDYRIYLSYARTGSASSPGAYPTTLYSWTSSVKSIKPTKVSGIKIWVGKYKQQVQE